LEEDPDASPMPLMRGRGTDEEVVPSFQFVLALTLEKKRRND